jgi:preprotein translocase subunit SecA
VDEVDNVLIDEARTPLIISGPASGDLEWYGRMAQIVRQLKPEDYSVNEKDRNVSLTEIGLSHVESLLGQPLMDPERPEDVTPEQARLTGYANRRCASSFPP